MTEYKILNKDCCLPVCLHSGPIEVSRMAHLNQGTQFEEQFGLPKGSHSNALNILAEFYGATGIAAIEDARIVGLLRFRPKQIAELFGGHLCPQEDICAKKLSCVNPVDLPSFNSLEPKALKIDCLQVVAQYQGKGIGGSLLDRTIEWAKEHGWEELHSPAVDDVLPVMAWSGHMSHEVLKRRGFQTAEKTFDAFITEAASHMRQGGHGKAVQEMCQKNYSQFPDDQMFFRYTMKMNLKSQEKTA
jgi:GNAT superfamily N-acetyltransferase